MKSYATLLRDPRWQKKRLEIMDRDKFLCRLCERGDLTLNVHHSYYEKGMMPWEYPEYTLFTLCEPCHEREERYKTQFDWQIALTFRRLGATNLQIEGLCLYVEAIAKEVGPGAALMVVRTALDEAIPFQARV